MLRQGTKNPYARKPTYGKDICELMRRINALEARTVPRQAVGWTVDADAAGDWMMCATHDGGRVYFVSYQIMTGTGALNYDIRVWAIDCSGSSVYSVIWESGTLEDPDAEYARHKYPKKPYWISADGDNRLWIKAAWTNGDEADDVTQLIKVSYKTIPPPAEVIVARHTVSGFHVTRAGSVSTYKETGGIGYNLLGHSAVGPEIAYAKPVSGGGFEVHAATGFVDALGDPHPLYQIETYSSSAVLQSIEVYSRPILDYYIDGGIEASGMGATDDYFSLYQYSSDDEDGAGPLLLRRDACPQLDLSDDYKSGTVVGALIPEAPVDAYVGTWSGTTYAATKYVFWGCVGASANNRLLSQAVRSIGDLDYVSTYTNVVALVTSTYNSGTGKWSHSVRTSYRLGKLGPELYDTYGRRFAMDRTGDVLGLVYLVAETPRLARWRVKSGGFASKTEWTAYHADGKTSLGTPDGGVSVPVDNALILAGAIPAAEHIVDMRTALLSLVDDQWALVFSEPRRLQSGVGAFQVCIGAWDYWGKWAGEDEKFPDDPYQDPDEVPNIVKPVLYVALEHEKALDREYGLVLEENVADGTTNPTPDERVASRYYRFRKGGDTAMDLTPMHDIDIGEVLALTACLEASYNDETMFDGYSPNWIPWGNGENGCPFGGD